MLRLTSPSLSLTLALFAVAPSAFGQAEAPEPPPPLQPWYDAVELGAFVDAYYNVNWAFPKPQDGSGVPTRYDARQTGFALSWVGLDASFAPEPVGGTLSLRFGPTATEHAGADAGTALEQVAQAFASWRPGGSHGMLRLDFGKFETIYGAEVPESHHNATYTRGVVWSTQPIFHTGLRANLELMPELGVSALLVNGINRSEDNNVGKTFGLQATLRPNDWLLAKVGWLGGPEQDDFATISCPADQAYSNATGACEDKPGAPGGSETVDRGGANDFEAWKHLVDVVVAVTPTPELSLLANFDYGTEGVRSIGPGLDTDVETESWYGGMLTARYAFTEVFAVALRGEYLKDEHGAVTELVEASGAHVTNAELATATLTLEAAPTENLLFRLEQRGDFLLSGSPSKNVYRNEERGAEDQVHTTTLGVVVKTD
ncbi:MAG: outer membrane beta-barrel protein [Polyangiaceae bacterium]